DFMPASYQKDVTGLVQEIGGQLDAELYDKTMVVVGKATKVLKEKKDFILNSKLAEQAIAGAPVPKEVISKNWDAVVGMLDTLASSEIKTAAGLKGLDVRAFLAGTGGKLMADGFALAAAMGQDPMKALEGFKAEAGTVEGDKATVKLTAPGGGEAKDETFVKVDGKWIPEDMAKDWTNAMAEAKKNLGGLPEQMKQMKPMAMGMLTQAEAAIDKLGAAKSQEEFDGVIVGLVASMQGGGGAPQPTPNVP
ncbi:MAG: hypothetical protein KC613_24710, partial [Myxococcales bacterium]|nr:hypothetical protein [Myxococcales bacterium]